MITTERRNHRRLRELGAMRGIIPHAPPHPPPLSSSWKPKEKEDSRREDPPPSSPSTAIISASGFAFLLPPYVLARSNAKSLPAWLGRLRMAGSMPWLAVAD